MTRFTNPRRFSTLPACLLLGGFASACNQPISGGQTGDGSEFVDEEPIGPSLAMDDAVDATLAESCVYEDTAVDIDDGAALGFSAEDVLDFATGPFDTEIAWDAERYGPEARAGMRLSLAYQGEPVVATLPMALDGGVAFECSSSLTIPVQVSIVTDGGALDETFAAVLTATSLELAKFTGSIDSADIQGELAPLDSSGDAEIDMLTIEGLVSRLGTSGSVLVTRRGNDAAGLGREVPATEDGLLVADVAGHWPAESCGASLELGFQPSGIVVDGETSVGGLSLDGIVRVLSEAGPVPLSWLDGGETELDLSLTAGESACAIDAYNGRFSLNGPVRLEMSTRDGRFSANVDAIVDGWPSRAGDLDGVTLNVNFSSSSPSMFQEQVSLDGADVSDFESVSLSMALMMSAKTRDLSGRLSISGFQDTDCTVSESRDPEGQLVTCPDEFSSVADADLGSFVE